MPRNIFFAYPGYPEVVSDTITAACQKHSNGTSSNTVVPWTAMEIFGSAIADTVRASVRKADALIADVTIANQNVYYEIGYAIGLGKPIAPVVNIAVDGATRKITQLGLFDTIGYKSYQNSDELTQILEQIPENSALVDLYAKPKNSSQPFYVVDTVAKTDFRNAIISSIKNSSYFYRSFDPVETTRMSIFQFIAEITSSSGVVVPLLSQTTTDHENHNLRAAFVAGLSHGAGIKTLMIVKEGSTGFPLDYRDLLVEVKSEQDIFASIKEFGSEALLALQVAPQKRKSPKSKLQSLTLGASAAENEFRVLDEYFVETAEYVRTLRGEVSVVSGRKGSGKTAIFFMVRDEKRRNRSNLVTDLKPESHQLSLFRSELSKLLDLGVLDHTLAAFWYFVFLSEIAITIQKDLNHKAKYEAKALASLREIEELLSEFGIEGSGDFTARINRLSRYVLDEIKASKEAKRPLSPEKITNIVFRGGITHLKQAILTHTNSKSDLLLLFDNIDKGWPTNGVDEFDVRLVRLMLETLDKLRRDFDALDRNFTSVVFLRNDIYELLVEQTPDRGKAGQIRIDWNDRAKLRQVIYKRLQTSSGNNSSAFISLWREYFVESVGEIDSFDYCVNHCLMRPRFLINIIEAAVANAINRGHSSAQEEDIIDAVSQHSNNLVSEFGYEIRDASGITEEILFSLIGHSKISTKTEIKGLLKSVGITEANQERAFELMLWYGVLGIEKNSNEKYIYDFDYSFTRLKAEIRRLGERANFTINDAIYVAL